MSYAAYIHNGLASERVNSGFDDLGYVLAEIGADPSELQAAIEAGTLNAGDKVYEIKEVGTVQEYPSNPDILFLKLNQ